MTSTIFQEIELNFVNSGGGVTTASTTTPVAATPVTVAAPAGVGGGVPSSAAAEETTSDTPPPPDDDPDDPPSPQPVLAVPPPPPHPNTGGNFGRLHYLDYEALKSFSDVTLLSRGPNPHEPHVRATSFSIHRMVLVSLSPYLRHILEEYKENDNQDDDIVILTEIEPEHLSLIGQFLTTGYLRSEMTDSLKSSFACLGLELDKMLLEQVSFSLEPHVHFMLVDELREKETVRREELTCIQCGQLFQNKQTYQLHKSKMGLYHGNRCVQCPSASAVFKTWREHKAHLDVMHGGVFRFVCGACPLVFRLETEMMQHRKDEHPIPRRKKACTLCGKVYSALHLKKHMYDAHGTENLECPHCKKILLSKESLRDHIAASHQKFPCNFCGKLQRNKMMYQTHIATMHTPEEQKPYQCRYCPKGFGKKRAWQEHENIHTNTRPFKCRYPDCNAAFNAIGNKSHHEKTVHGGVKRPPRMRNK